MKGNEIMQDVMERTDMPSEYCWNVADMFASQAMWEETYEKYKGEDNEIRWPNLQSYKGKLHDPKTLRLALDEYFELDRQFTRLYVYAHLRNDEDLGNDKNKGSFLRISSLLHQFSSEISWVQPELLSLSEEQYNTLLKDENLAPYHRFLQQLNDLRPYTLSEQEEHILALSGNALQGAGQTYGIFENADLSFSPAMDKKGKEHPLSLGSYSVYIKDKDRALRQSAYENLHKGFMDFENTVSSLLSTQVQTHLFFARAKGYKNCLEAALQPHHIDTKVYYNLINCVKKHLPSLHRYVKLRKKMLGVDKLYPYDLYVSLFEENFSFTYDQARELVVESVAPLGKEYQDTLFKGLFEQRWVDVYENARKRSGAYSSGCYDSMPYILMNYHGTLRDLMTLAHEAGHSMHSYYSNTHQPYQYANYPIFLAEVASTFQEQLLLQLLLDQIDDQKQRAALYNYAVEGIRTTLIRQTLFAEFELYIHECAEKNIPLTPTLLKDKFAQLYREYYGDDLEIDEYIKIEWARIPHFYYNFYVYQYATGISTAFALFNKLQKDPTSSTSYLQFLSSGSSEYPLTILQKAGADLTNDQVINEALSYFDSLVDSLEQTHQQLTFSK